MRAIRGSENRLTVPPTAMYSALRIERDLFQTFDEALMHESQYIPELVEVTKKLRAKVAVSENLNASARTIPTKR